LEALLWSLLHVFLWLVVCSIIVDFLKQLGTCLFINDDGFGGTKAVSVGVVVPLCASLVDVVSVSSLGSLSRLAECPCVATGP
jgi:hypothetical protein